MNKAPRISRPAPRANAWRTATAPPSVHHVLRTPGTPLDNEIRQPMEPHFKHDFGKVRVHTDAASAASAKELRAAAYTVGNDIVFAAGRYAPGFASGRRLIAHELTHVVQQGRFGSSVDSQLPLTIAPAGSLAEHEADRAAPNASPVPRLLQRKPEDEKPEENPEAYGKPEDDNWSGLYEDRKTFVQVPYKTYQEGVGDIRPTAQGGLSKNTGGNLKVAGFDQTPAGADITVDILKEIYPNIKNDLASGEAPADYIDEYCKNLNTAFHVMRIDTVEARAYYLAHAFVESDQFRLLTERGDGPRHDWDRTAITPDTDADRKYFAGKYPRDLTMKINPFGNAEFIGRGPVQVTGRGAYLEALALIEKAADEYGKKAAADKNDKQSRDFAALCRRAAKAIKADPQQAADPEFTFLFSAAFLKAKGGDVSRANKDRGAWTGSDPVGGGTFKPGSAQETALGVKSKAFRDIHKVLMREAKNAGVPGAEKKYQKILDDEAKAAKAPKK